MLKTCSFPNYESTFSYTKLHSSDLNQFWSKRCNAKSPLLEQPHVWLTTKVNNEPTELDTFLPTDEPSITVTTTKTNGESNDSEAANKADFDPLTARQLEHPVSELGTLIHLLKSSLGTGILAMPAAFKDSGIVLGVFITIIVSIICTHCAYVLVQCAHTLYRKTGKTSLSFPDVAEECCLRGPPWARKFAKVSRYFVLWGIFITYFATCSCYAVIVAENFNYVAANYIEVNTQMTIGLLLFPLILIAYVPNLKYLAPFSMVANVCMAVGLGITFYFLLTDVPSISEREAVVGFRTLPVSISIVIFAIEAIGVVMPLENNMQRPKKFVGLFGILNQGMAFVTLIYIVLGFLGFLKYGNETLGSITLNLPRANYFAQAVNVLIGLAVFFTYGLVLYVCLDIAWTGMQHRFSKNKLLANYILRTVLVVVSVLIAIGVPQIVPFVGLIGAFCFSSLGLICPVFIEVLTYWDDGFGRFNWKIGKHIIVILTGMIALIFGSKSAIIDIVNSS